MLLLVFVLLQRQSNYVSVWVYLYCLYMGLSFPCRLQKGKAMRIWWQSGAVPVCREVAHGTVHAAHRCPGSNCSLQISRSMCLVCCQTRPAFVLGQDVFSSQYLLLLMNLSYGLNSVKGRGKRHPRKGKEKLTEVWGKWCWWLALGVGGNEADKANCTRRFSSAWCGICGI